MSRGEKCCFLKKRVSGMHRRETKKFLVLLLSFSKVHKSIYSKKKIKIKSEKLPGERSVSASAPRELSVSVLMGALQSVEL